MPGRDRSSLTRPRSRAGSDWRRRRPWRQRRPGAPSCHRNTKASPPAASPSPASCCRTPAKTSAIACSPGRCADRQSRSHRARHRPPPCRWRPRFPSRIGRAIFSLLSLAAAATMRASSPSGKTILRSRRRAISNKRSSSPVLLTGENTSSRTRLIPEKLVPDVIGDGTGSRIGILRNRRGHQ